MFVDYRYCEIWVLMVEGEMPLKHSTSSAHSVHNL